VEPWCPQGFIPLEGIQRACLAFCISLLCQNAHKHEYENALVCALAVLGVDPHGWKGYDTYPPILSSVIKISRFMTIQHAFQETTQSPMQPTATIYIQTAVTVKTTTTINIMMIICRRRAEASRMHRRGSANGGPIHVAHQPRPHGMDVGFRTYPA